MRDTILRGITILSMILCLLCLGGCDSSSNSANGGGQGNTSGYTTADLAGRWGGVFNQGIPGDNDSMTIWFDESGNALAFAASDTAAVLSIKGRVTVDCDGRLKGVTVIYYDKTPGEHMEWSGMRFISPTQLKGLLADLTTAKPDTFPTNLCKQ